VSSFNADAFLFDLVRLDGRDDVPRPFLHRHGYYHLLWISDARGQHLLDFDTLEVRPHSVFFIAPGQMHAWKSDIAPAGYVLNFSAEFFLQIYPRPEDIPFFHLDHAHPALYLSAQQHRELLPLVQSIEQEFNGAAAWRNDAIRAATLMLMTRLRRLQPERAASDAAPRHYHLARRFRLLVEQHYLEAMPVRDFAAALQVTERRLNEAVRQATGKTASALIQERILLEAKRLLTQSELGVSEVCYRLNFEDPAYFSRFFKKHTASSPLEFKKRYAGPVF
jgi:AraC family transcriptional regulator, transcriptional activator of pobA